MHLADEGLVDESLSVREVRMREDRLNTVWPLCHALLDFLLHGTLVRHLHLLQLIHEPDDLERFVQTILRGDNKRVYQLLVLLEVTQKLQDVMRRYQLLAKLLNAYLSFVGLKISLVQLNYHCIIRQQLLANGLLHI